MNRADWKNLAAMVACYWITFVGLPLLVLGFAWLRGWSC